MPTVAEQLRAAREAQKLTVHQVAEITKIRTDHLHALEEGNYDVFSAPVYIRGFTRSCATVLKLDVPKIMAQLDAELSGTEKFSEPPNLTPHPRTPLDFIMLQLSRINWRLGAVVVAALVVLGLGFGIYRAWHHYRTSDPLKDLPPGVYQPPAAASGETLPLNPPPKR
jgi:cytoskeletal protein RodZ